MPREMCFQRGCEPFPVPIWTVLDIEDLDAVLVYLTQTLVNNTCTLPTIRKDSEI